MSSTAGLLRPEPLIPDPSVTTRDQNRSSMRFAWIQRETVFIGGGGGWGCLIMAKIIISIILVSTVITII